MSYQLLTRVGNIAAGEVDHLWLPRTRTGKHGVLLHHGASTPDTFCRESWPATAALAAILANAGFVCAAGQLGTLADGVTDPWTNDTDMARMTSALGYLAANGADASKMHLFGISMGGGSAIRYAETYPAKVASLTAGIPMANIIRLYESNVPPGATTGIGTAWAQAHRNATIAVTTGSPNITSADANFTGADVGAIIAFAGGAGARIASVQSATTATIASNGQATGNFPATLWADTLPAGANFLANAAAIKNAGIPTQFFYSTIDPYITPTDVTALAAAAGGTAVAIDSTYGHADGTIGEIASYNGGTLYSALIAFLTAADA